MAMTKRGRQLAIISVAVSIVFGSLGGCRPASPPPPQKVDDAAQTASDQSHQPDGLRRVELALNWFPEAEHGGFFAALVHGYFREAGLDVRILAGGPNAPVLQRVARGQVAFGVENADRILSGRAQEADVQALMAPLQKSPRAIMVHAESRFQRIADIANATLAVNSGAPWMQFVRKRVPLTNVRLVPYSGNVAPFLIDKNYAQQAYVFSEPFIAQEKGAAVRCLLVAQTGYNPYTSVLFTSREMVRTQPETVKKLVKAAVRGWQMYLAQPEETNRYIEKINPKMTQPILAFGAKTLRALCLDGLPNAESVGRMTAERWQQLAEQLVEADVLKSAGDPLAAFTVAFLPHVPNATTTKTE